MTNTATNQIKPLMAIRPTISGSISYL